MEQSLYADLSVYDASNKTTQSLDQQIQFIFSDKPRMEKRAFTVYKTMFKGKELTPLGE